MLLLFKQSKESISVSAIIFISFAVLIDHVSSEYGINRMDNDNDNCVGSNCADRDDNGVSGSMWFGPRLGRRRRSGMNELDDRDVNAISDAINSGSWVVGSPQGLVDKKHSTQFTPRLGRELGDEVLQKFLEVNNIDRLSHLMESQVDQPREGQTSGIPAFSPRLGRHILPRRPFLNIFRHI